MTGVWTGKVRSTPTPKLTLRTVKVSRTPAPWRRMATPWKTWMRERVPSTTLTWTFRVSPGRNSGMSERRPPASRASNVCMGISSLAVPQVTHGGGVAVVSGPVGCCALPVAGALAADRSRSVCHRGLGPGQSAVRARDPAQLPEQGEVAAVQRGRVERGDEVRAPFGRTPQRLVATPPRNLAVVAGEQHLGHRVVPPDGRLGVAGSLEQPPGRGAVRLVHERLGVADDTGQQPRDRLDDREHRDLAAVEDVVAQGDLEDAGAAGCLVEHPLVDALVAPAREDQVLLGCQVGRHRLGEGDTARRGHDDDGG